MSVLVGQAIRLPAPLLRHRHGRRIACPTNSEEPRIPVLRILGRYIFREILSSALLGTLLATFVLFLQKADPIFELLVRSSGANSRVVLEMFALAVPGVLPYTIPFGVLVGILI